MRLDAKLEDISDGNLYDLNDMVRMDTRGCEGCSACCHGVGNTIVLTPFDGAQIVAGTGMDFRTMLGNQIELHEEGKLMLPNLRMSGENEGCGFLNEQERCSIHNHRPGICRLFPLGRYYEDEDFKYIFKSGECIKPNLSKIKVKKWIGIQNYSDNKAFILAWFNFLKALQFRVKFIRDEDELAEVNRYLLEQFYESAWPEGKGFYEIFETRLAEAKNRLGVL